jgi:hypothetical protein
MDVHLKEENPGPRRKSTHDPSSSRSMAHYAIPAVRCIALDTPLSLLHHSPVLSKNKVTIVPDHTKNINLSLGTGWTEPRTH